MTHLKYYKYNIYIITNILNYKLCNFLYIIYFHNSPLGVNFDAYET